MWNPQVKGFYLHDDNSSTRFDQFTGKWFWLLYNITNNRNETYNGSTWVGNTHYIGESYSGGIVLCIMMAGSMV